MAIQDDIFDIRVALAGKPELEAFERIMVVFNRLDEQYMNQEKVLAALGAGLRALDWIKEEYKK